MRVASSSERRCAVVGGPRSPSSGSCGGPWLGSTSRATASGPGTRQCSCSVLHGGGKHEGSWERSARRRSMPMPRSVRPFGFRASSVATRAGSASTASGRRTRSTSSGGRRPPNCRPPREGAQRSRRWTCCGVPSWSPSARPRPPSASTGCASTSGGATCSCRRSIGSTSTRSSPCSATSVAMWSGCACGATPSAPRRSFGRPSRSSVVGAASAAAFGGRRSGCGSTAAWSLRRASRGTFGVGWPARGPTASGSASPGPSSRRPGSSSRPRSGSSLWPVAARAGSACRPTESESCRRSSRSRASSVGTNCGSSASRNWCTDTPCASRLPCAATLSGTAASTSWPRWCAYSGTTADGSGSCPRPSGHGGWSVGAADGKRRRSPRPALSAMQRRHTSTYHRAAVPW
mmetsp:Transcript_42330/g.122440  ORF Transcript_42330/g.122440 Transcript_42330/m.122440 type:complete len:404 (+) Transcript_42330:416-1627(+)